MSDINRITLIGNVGQDPDFKYFESGAMSAKFTLAVKRYDTKKKEETTDWFIIKTFCKLSEHISKGKRVAVDGKLQTDTWTTEDGENRKSVYVFADNLQILTPKEE